MWRFERGCCNHIAAHRPSMRDLYHVKWRSFSRWCAGRGKDPLHPSIRTVLSYLQHLKCMDLKHSTILSLVSALSWCTNKVDGVPVGKYPLVAKWNFGNRSLHPPQHSLVPPWDLSVILVAFTEKPYEPLHFAPPKPLMLKVLFLIAAASNRSISELHALCIDPPFLLENPLSFLLAPNPAFWPKTATEVALTLDIELRAFYPEPICPLERWFQLVCPVRVL